MLYTFFVLMFGIYLGQEYPQIPSVKITVENFIERLKEKENDQVQNTRSERLQESGSASFEMVVAPKRRSGYYSLPIWISNWWSSQESLQETSQEMTDDHIKTD